MRFINFLKSVIQEMKIVFWPNAKQTREDTSTVLGVTILFAIFFAVVDSLVQVFLKLL
ncbi:preprotein translocase subunit SecE [Nicoliella spurrieriana]|uniref:Protein translocase subunit SecE n=1 Tax=Nicoliella spurrieriana TaxID=2925830 RepID=A0A976X5R0_9LACO|nr:preprotein translocase subunit SecE [Nicoliella spurrieriana]UQS87016.1 preprotein translocase subunit SecE [Nicoliella spurrieriana]